MQNRTAINLHNKLFLVVMLLFNCADRGILRNLKLRMPFSKLYSIPTQLYIVHSYL